MPQLLVDTLNLAMAVTAEAGVAAAGPWSCGAAAADAVPGSEADPTAAEDVHSPSEGPQPVVPC